MPTESWRSPETIERLNRLDRPGFAAEFLRRNAEYRRGYDETQRQIARKIIAPRRRSPASLPDGGCAFAHDPTDVITPELTLWLPEAARQPALTSRRRWTDRRLNGRP